MQVASMIFIIFKSSEQDVDSLYLPVCACVTQ
jgi:hypothetical protein|eukprot:SAG25_NODE_1946_length_2110_cov_1.935356_5_plen_32_part_00